MSTESNSEARQALGKRLRDARKRARLSQHDVAREFACARQTVASWETGNSVPNALQVMALAILYGCSADCLLFGFAPEQAGQLPAGELESMTPAVRRRLEVLWQVFVRTGAADPEAADAK